MSKRSNTNDEIGELSSAELDAIVGGGVDWGHVGNTINKVNGGVGIAMQGGLATLGFAALGAAAIVRDLM